MKFDLVSFDLQGTLSDSAYSDEFWLSLLPELYAEHHCIEISDARERLKSEFSSMGKYDRRYYCPKYWIEALCPGVAKGDVYSRLRTRPHLYADTLEVVRELVESGVPLIVTTTTTYDFIERELGEKRQYFQRVFSTLDDLSIAGKTPEVFEKIADHFSASPDRLLHVGDCPEMDIANAKAAGWETYFFDRKIDRAMLVGGLRHRI